MSRRSHFVNQLQQAARWGTFGLALLPGMLLAVEPSFAIREPRTEVRVATTQPRKVAVVEETTAAQPAVIQPLVIPQNLPPGTQFILVPVPQNVGRASQPVGAAQVDGLGSPSYGNVAQPKPSAPQIRPEHLQGLSQQVGRVTGQAWQLAERNALYSARQKFEEGLQLAATGVDGQTGGNEHSKALAEAFTAFAEAEDFAARASGLHSEKDVARIVEFHRTPVLKDAPSGMPGVQALQAYYRFGLQQLIAATGKIPTAADALHGLGKVHTFLAREENSDDELHSARAIAYQQAALDINPKHARASAELGVLLALHGQFPEAKQALLHSLRNRPQAETWRNLSVVHQRLGEVDLAQRAEYECNRLTGGMNSSGAVAAGVQWMDPNQFAQQSRPNVAPPMPAMPQQQVSRQPNTMPPGSVQQSAFNRQPTGYYPR